MCGSRIYGLDFPLSHSLCRYTRLSFVLCAFTFIAFSMALVRVVWFFFAAWPGHRLRPVCAPCRQECLGDRPRARMHTRSPQIPENDHAPRRPFQRLRFYAGICTIFCSECHRISEVFVGRSRLFPLSYVMSVHDCGHVNAVRMFILCPKFERRLSMICVPAEK